MVYAQPERRNARQRPSEKLNEGDRIVITGVSGALLGTALGSVPGFIVGGILGALAGALRNQELRRAGSQGRTDAS